MVGAECSSPAGPTPSSGAGHGRPLEEGGAPEDRAAAGRGRGRGAPGTATTGAGRGRAGLALGCSDSPAPASTGSSRTSGPAAGLVKKRFKNLGKLFFLFVQIRIR